MMTSLVNHTCLQGVQRAPISAMPRPLQALEICRDYENPQKKKEEKKSINWVWITDCSVVRTPRCESTCKNLNTNTP